MTSLDKRAVAAALRAEIAAEIAHMTRIAREAAEAATHEENKPEGDKDMRSTEASYIARGQAERVHELERAHALLASMDLKSFGEGAAIESSALVELRAENTKTTSLYFLVVAGGGRKLTGLDREVQTLTFTTPLGKALLGMAQGDEVEIETPQGRKTYEIVRVT